MNSSDKGKILFIPDMEYKSWVNRNAELISEIIESGRINVAWLNKGSNKEFLIRRLHELGYSIDIK